MNFHTRLRDYYRQVALVLRGEADAAAVFPNPSDVGSSRERLYVDFLKQHAPSKCSVSLGGYLFHLDGTESKQLDVIVTTDTAPRYGFHNRDGHGRSFAPVEGTLGVVSIKSRLNKTQLYDALDGLASIPPTESLDNRVSPGLRIRNYDDWPFKVIYATDGVKATTLLSHVRGYYESNRGIPHGRWPNVIHVAGRYAIIRTTTAMSQSDQRTPLEPGTFQVLDVDPDLQAICWVLDGLQTRASASTHILFKYHELLNELIDMAYLG